MTIDPRRRARQLAKKAAQRKAQLAKKRKAGQDAGSIWSSMLCARIVEWPLHESYIPRNLVEMNLGNVVISRRMGSQIAAGVFLVDTGCLGVKDAFLSILSPDEYRNMLYRFREREPLASVKPECACKLIEGAVAYAADLGFDPHKDYHRAKAIFGAIDTAMCDTSFNFGRDGKPFYCSGPFETPARRKQVLDILTNRCGPDGFHFMIGVGDFGLDDFVE